MISPDCRREVLLAAFTVGPEGPLAGPPDGPPNPGATVGRLDANSSLVKAAITRLQHGAVDLKLQHSRIVGMRR